MYLFEIKVRLEDDSVAWLQVQAQTYAEAREYAWRAHPLGQGGIPLEVIQILDTQELLQAAG